MKTIASLGLLLLLASSLAAQTVPPVLMIQQDGRSVPLGLTKVQTEVRIFGSVAETTTTMTFTNPMTRVMEGNLYFPLPEGATIDGYALDINGAMVDGVAVEKHEARRVFEEVVRQGVDPGLVEWTKGNNFQTRVFPIPARGSRTIRVRYITELIGGTDAPAYHLPLAFKDKLREFSLRVEVVKPAATPKVTKGELANFSFEKWHENYVAETKQQDASLIEDLVIALPKTDQPQVVVEKADDGQMYFAINDYPVEPKLDLATFAPKRVVIFWDASGSRAGDHKREIEVLKRYLIGPLGDPVTPLARFGRGAGGEGEPKIAVDLVLVRNVASKPVRIEFSKSSPSALVTALETVQYDGGTQLGAIGPLSGAEKPDFYVLVTDGISNFGGEDPGRLDAPLVVFSAAASANHAFLHSLAMTNGGRYFNLTNWKDTDVVKQAGRSAWSFLVASIDGGERKDLYPQLPQPLMGRFTLVGKLTDESATVSVDYGIQGRQSDKRTFKVSRSEAVEGSLLRRLWAQKKLAELMISQKRNEKEIAALGKQFGMVTPYTSLLVLDTLEQYVRYEIAPPKSLPTMREEYMRRIDTIEHQKQKQKADKLAEVVRMWQERVKWWDTEFKYPKDFKYAADKKKTPGGAVMSQPYYMQDDIQSAPSGGSSGRPAAMGGMGGRGSGRRGPLGEQSAEQGRRSDNPRPVEGGRTLASPLPRASARVAPAPGGATLSDFDSLTDLVTSTIRPQAWQGGEENHGQSSGRQPGIVIKQWNPDMPYLKELRAAKAKGDLLSVYMKNRTQYGNSPAFFLDCADFFREAKNPDLALQVLSNIAELELEDASLLRVLGHRLLQIGQLDLAVQTFEQVLELRPEEPQSYRDLALTLARRAEQAVKGGSHAKDSIRDDYRRAIDLFIRVVMGRWDDRFPEIEVIALEEVNHIIPQAKAVGVSDVPLDPRLVKLLDVDVRIVMTWHADNTDIDLWVTEPSGEKAFYSHNRTTIGGLVSRDFTQGYGPEEYLVRRAAHGMYKIEANYYGSRATRLLGPVTVQVNVLTNYGRPNEQCKSLTIRLKEAKETVPIGEIEF